ncbi:MAG: YIP1 family protein [Chloroflexi bacterium]|nr:YIP1 family protein [Chloroflexota bacterium]
MNAIGEYLNLGLGALFLQEETYARMRDDSRRVVKGLIFILLVGVIVALLAVVGKLLEWSTTPDLSNIRNIVLEEMRNTTWFREMARSPQAMQQFQQGYDLWWQFFGGLFGVNMLGAIANVITNPIVLILRWLVYGVVVFVFARMLGGKGTLSQTLGCTAIAFAPEALGAAQFLPFVQLAGIGIWGLICTYVGVKVSNQMMPWRAFWATLLPFIVVGVITILFGCIGGFALSALGGGR